MRSAAPDQAVGGAACGQQENVREQIKSMESCAPSQEPAGMSAREHLQDSDLERSQGLGRRSRNLNTILEGVPVGVGCREIEK